MLIYWLRYSARAVYLIKRPALNIGFAVAASNLYFSLKIEPLYVRCSPLQQILMLL
jgi:hypothetical protein